MPFLFLGGIVLTLDKKKYFSVLQRLGKSLMLPVSVLPVAGLMVAFGRIFQNLESNMLVFSFLGNILFRGGFVVFENLPLIFAIGVSLGFSRGEGICGLSGAIGYMVMESVLEAVVQFRNMGIHVETGVVGGIAVGILAGISHNLYPKIKLPNALGFFSGKRLIPIITSFLGVFLGLVFGFLWPPIQYFVIEIGRDIINLNFMGFKLSGALFAAGNRILIPVGLHHVFYAPFLFEFGQYTNSAGDVFKGEIARFFAGDPTAGHITASEFPVKIYGLPCAALAIILRSKDRKKTAGILLSAALASIITGITEPIEFSFIFTAPILYGVHVFISFISGFLTDMFSVRLGYTFTSSLIDFFLGYFTGNTNNAWMMMFVIGPIIGFLYFVTFYYLIEFFDLKTMGRESENSYNSIGLEKEKIKKIIMALGEAKNILDVDACITRLRLELIDVSKVDKKQLVKLGASGFMDDGHGNIQIVFGTEVEEMKDEIRKYLKLKKIEDEMIDSFSNENIKDMQHINYEVINSPIKGLIIDLKDVPDEIFAQGILGEGIAIDPAEGKVYSPCDGIVIQLFKTNHAVSIKTKDGLEILIHIGIDTVKLKGQGFKSLVEQGQEIKKGQLILEFDLEEIKKSAKSTYTPLLITGGEGINSIEVLKKGFVNPNEELLKVKKIY